MILPSPNHLLDIDELYSLNTGYKLTCPSGVLICADESDDKAIVCENNYLYVYSNDSNTFKCEQSPVKTNDNYIQKEQIDCSNYLPTDKTFVNIGYNCIEDNSNFFWTSSMYHSYNEISTNIVLKMNENKFKYIISFWFLPINVNNNNELSLNQIIFNAGDIIIYAINNQIYCKVQDTIKNLEITNDKSNNELKEGHWQNFIIYGNSELNKVYFTNIPYIDDNILEFDSSVMFKGIRFTNYQYKGEDISDINKPDENTKWLSGWYKFIEVSYSFDTSIISNIKEYISYKNSLSINLNNKQSNILNWLNENKDELISDISISLIPSENITNKIDVVTKTNTTTTIITTNDSGSDYVLLIEGISNDEFENNNYFNLNKIVYNYNTSNDYNGLIKDNCIDKNCLYCSNNLSYCFTCKENFVLDNLNKCVSISSINNYLYTFNNRQNFDNFIIFDINQQNFIESNSAYTIGILIKIIKTTNTDKYNILNLNNIASLELFNETNNLQFSVKDESNNYIEVKTIDYNNYYNKWTFILLGYSNYLNKENVFRINNDIYKSFSFATGTPIKQLKISNEFISYVKSIYLMKSSDIDEEIFMSNNSNVIIYNFNGPLKNCNQFTSNSYTYNCKSTDNNYCDISLTNKFFNILNESTLLLDYKEVFNFNPNNHIYSYHFGDENYSLDNNHNTNNYYLSDPNGRILRPLPILGDKYKHKLISSYSCYLFDDHISMLPKKIQKGVINQLTSKDARKVHIYVPFAKDNSSTSDINNNKYITTIKFNVSININVETILKVNTGDFTNNEYQPNNTLLESFTFDNIHKKEIYNLTFSLSYNIFSTYNNYSNIVNDNVNKVEVDLVEINNNVYLPIEIISNNSDIFNNIKFIRADVYKHIDNNTNNSLSLNDNTCSNNDDCLTTYFCDNTTNTCKQCWPGCNRCSTDNINVCISDNITNTFCSYLSDYYDSTNEKSPNCPLRYFNIAATNTDNINNGLQEVIKIDNITPPVNNPAYTIGFWLLCNINNNNEIHLRFDDILTIKFNFSENKIKMNFYIYRIHYSSITKDITSNSWIYVQIVLANKPSLNSNTINNSVIILNELNNDSLELVNNKTYFSINNNIYSTYTLGESECKILTII